MRQFMPVTGTVTQSFDTPVTYIVGRTKHEAIDIVTEGSQPISLPFPCEVSKVIDMYDYLPNSGFGNQVYVRLPNGDEYRFCHLKRDSMLSMGTFVPSNTIIAWTGQTGYRDPIDIFHTHWEQYRDGKRIDPLTNIPNTYMKLKDVGQIIYIKNGENWEHWLIFKREGKPESKRRVVGPVASACYAFAEQGQYHKWETPEQFALFSGYEQGSDFNFNEYIKNNPDKLELE